MEVEEMGKKLTHREKKKFKKQQECEKKDGNVNENRWSGS